jgi:hypothetical protein
MTSWSQTEPDYLDLREAPPAGSGDILPFSSATMLANFRHWLIRKLAGNHTIVINAHIGVIKRLDDRNVLGRMTQTGEGILLWDSYLYCDDERMLLISNNAK